MPHARAALLALVALGLAPSAAGQMYQDFSGDASGLDVTMVIVTFGNGTIGVDVQFGAGQLPEGRAVRGVVLIGSPGAPEPAEWYQVTIANETTAYIGHGPQPRLAELVASSWTVAGASAQWRRDGQATGECVFAVVEAGTMGSMGFVRSDVAPWGFESPEEAWPVEQCPGELIIEGPGPRDGKGSPGLPLVGLMAVLAFALFARRR